MAEKQTNGAPALPPKLVDQLIDSYHAQPSTQHLDSCFLPSRARTIELIEMLRRVVFPGFFDETRVTSETVRDHLSSLMNQVRDLLYEQVHEAINYGLNKSEGRNLADRCDKRSREVTLEFLNRLLDVREMLATDVRAAFDGDPASVGLDETVFCYPGVDAVFIYRIAHELYKLDVPLLPRIMTEYAHNETGIDIHPGATIGRSFFIDHGTGVVIGETAEIGDRVQIYQGVTLGALAPKNGDRWRGRKRHPTLEDDVTIYGGAIILGGEVVIAEGATIGGAVFITASIPAGATVTMDRPDLKVRATKPRLQSEPAS